MKHFHASLAALIGRAEASVHQSHQSHQRSSGDPQAPRLQLDACGAPGSWKRRAGAVWTVGNSRRLINPKSHSRMYHHSAIRAHAWPPRLQSPEGKCNSRPSLRYSTATHASICGDVDGSTLCTPASWFSASLAFECRKDLRITLKLMMMIQGCDIAKSVTRRRTIGAVPDTSLHSCTSYRHLPDSSKARSVPDHPRLLIHERLDTVSILVADTNSRES